MPSHAVGRVVMSSLLVSANLIVIQIANVNEIKTVEENDHLGKGDQQGVVSALVPGIFVWFDPSGFIIYKPC